MMPMRMPGISLTSRVTVAPSFFRTWARHGYMLPVVSKLKTISTRLSMTWVVMVRVPLGFDWLNGHSDTQCI